MKTYPRVRDLLQSDIDSGMSLRAVCRKVDLHPNTVGSYLEGRAEAGEDSLEKIAKAYGKTVSWLRGANTVKVSNLAEKLGIDTKEVLSRLQQLGYSVKSSYDELEPVPPSTSLIPVVGLASANGDGPCWEDAYPVGHGIQMIHRPHDVIDPKAFGVKVDGDSMSPKYEDGDIVVVCPQKQVTSGMPVVVKLSDGRVMIKRIRYINDHVLLESINASYEPIFVKRDQVEFAYKIVWTKGG